MHHPSLIAFPNKHPHDPLRLETFHRLKAEKGGDYTQAEFHQALLDHGKETKNDFFAMLQERQIFQDRVVFLTGGANGIGETIAQTYRLGGARVAVFDFDPKITEKYQLDRDGILGVRCDITKYDLLPDLIFAAHQKLGAYADIVVLNAGMFPSEMSIRNFDAEEMEVKARVNVNGNMNFLSQCLPMLQHSAIAGLDVNVVGIGTRNVPAPSPKQFAYNGPKACLVQGFKTWSQDPDDVLPYRIRMNGVHPTSVFDHTKLWTPEKMEASAKSKPNLTVDGLITFNLMRNEIGAADVAAAVVNLSTPNFRHTTGLWVPVDGGFSAVIAKG